MKSWKICAVLLFLIFFAVKGLSETEGSLSVDVKKLSDRIAVFKIHGGDANIVALNSEKGIVVIDTDISPSFAVLLRQKMTEVFGHENFAYVINTHSHGDHTSGNQVFSDAIIIGHENCPEAMKKDDEGRERSNAQIKAGVERMKAMLGKMEAGSDQAESMVQRISYYEIGLQGRGKDFVLTPPSLTFREGMTLYLGDLELDLMYFGRSHSQSDILIHCPQEGLWMTGDLFFPGGDMYIDSERALDLSRWVANLEKIVGTEKDTRTIIPGHADFLAMDDLKKKLDYINSKQQEFSGKESTFFAFKKALGEKGLETSLQVLKELKAKPEKFYTLHPEIDQFAYRLMLDEKLDEAVAIFVVLVELFPDSYLAFDSLGEVYKRKGDKERAIQNFEKSLELNPDNRNAAQQLKSLRDKK